MEVKTLLVTTCNHNRTNLHFMYSLNEDGSNLADAKYFYVQTIKVYQYRTNVYFFYLLKSICFTTIQTSLKSELNVVKTLF